MDKETVIQQLCEESLVAVIRGANRDEAGRTIEACIKGGIKFIEVTFTIPGAPVLMTALTEKYAGSDVVIGAGTVLDAATARIAILSGAQFIVSPCLDVETVKLCNRYRIAAMPGIMTVREAVMAMQAGADILKVFPGEIMGPKFVKALQGPLPQARLMPTGGVDLNNVGDWIGAGCVAVGVGGNLTRGAAKGDYEQVAAAARQFGEAVRNAKNSK
ncbi:bifunctional 2-keto-4-hydroxyglutarate aldolase/2-keto-3-deoxy-6-phosphogluconate aldolase [Sporomusa acidovorans]|uniref:KHG/KDPG aldolase n=1 Tax=Sporomusa acidovorans (strain ATCC 49682 / DSM 3132 / Mol) TaxID=1123286 RepID=A0ABZ3JAW4_SPOA4|nr:bifunctional 2-keto-4-hydroxyglutarate aldolase/2-keto-3-deoxy-6-phosphogluconate aldolase [Sporomusa acidovorans]OZC21732.1 KHG/KDPG aldolase [Sporomusa acidovorans DSM 3132]SDD58841.1 2-keto-3-deoxy-phosphogluconate aldolase [Sporomusa acidovorans]